jgi:glycine/D-amino acid oxidase-like deaminating enzyme
VSILTGVEVTDLDETAVLTDQGRIEFGEQLVIAPGPWAKRFWAMLDLPMTIEDRPMWKYWNLQEGEVAVDPALFATADGSAPPVIHLDTDARLETDNGELVTDELWGIYFKRDRHGVQGGASPLPVDGDVELDPYPQTTDVDTRFPDLFCAGLSHAMSRFEGCRAVYKRARSGGVGAFTADNFPVFDYVRPNVYGIFDSNHGYKMIAVGREVAMTLLGDHSSLLYPFRLERFTSGDLHPVSHSPYPWS